MIVSMYLLSDNMDYSMSENVICVSKLFTSRKERATGCWPL